MDLKALLAMPVAKLRDEAGKIEGLTGVKNMDKKQLLSAIAKRDDIKLPANLTYSEEGLKVKAKVSELKAKRKALVKEGKFAAARAARKHMKRALRDMNA